MKAIVTVKLVKNPKHNPHWKVEGICPVSINFKMCYCTDILGEHHSILVDMSTNSITEIENYVKSKGYNHITRVEIVEDQV